MAVFPGATEIPESDLQSIEMNSRTAKTLLFLPQHPDNTAKVRIFTPTMEPPFAGHPPSGTAVALARLLSEIRGRGLCHHGRAAGLLN
ncbi:MAG: hypothetical protein CSA70_03820 [Rhodobacterales bacterium]|nr:MAG: hypothetical protein CSA70_03820 [Rhodobacterales bacterium]